MTLIRVERETWYRVSSSLVAGVGTLVISIKSDKDRPTCIHLTFSRSDHQGVHKVWGTQLDATGRYQPIDMQ
jgi:hypothetical protein